MSLTFTAAGKPARPLPPTVDRDGDVVNITVTTPHSGVRGSSDNFQFILQVLVLAWNLNPLQYMTSGSRLHHKFETIKLANKYINHSYNSLCTSVKAFPLKY